MRARGVYLCKVRVKVKPRGSLSAVEKDELRSEVMESLGDEGRGPVRRGPHWGVVGEGGWCRHG